MGQQEDPPNRQALPSWHWPFLAVGAQIRSWIPLAGFCPNVMIIGKWQEGKNRGHCEGKHLLAPGGHKGCVCSFPLLGGEEVSSGNRARAWGSSAEQPRVLPAQKATSPLLREMRNDHLPSLLFRAQMRFEGRM